MLIRNFWLLLWIPFLLSGCSPVAISNKISCKSPQDSPYQIEKIQRDDGSVDYWWDIDSKIKVNTSSSASSVCSIKYHSLWDTAGFIVVEGTINDGKTGYPVVLDTGASQAVFVSKNHIRDNNLTLVPIKQNSANGGLIDLVNLHRLNIADISFVDWPCFYFYRSFPADLFNFSAGNGNYIILGLPALKEFKYIVFDSPNKNVEFSKDISFSPESSLWEKFPISIEQDFHGNSFLFVQLDIAGKTVELQLDTGSGHGLAVSEDIWQQIQQNIDPVKFRKGTDVYPYIGNLSCKKALLPKIKLANIQVTDAMVSVFPAIVL